MRKRGNLTLPNDAKLLYFGSIDTVCLVNHLSFIMHRNLQSLPGRTCGDVVVTYLKAWLPSKR